MSDVIGIFFYIGIVNTFRTKKNSRKSDEICLRYTQKPLPSLYARVTLKPLTPCTLTSDPVIRIRQIFFPLTGMVCSFHYLCLKPFSDVQFSRYMRKTVTSPPKQHLFDPISGSDRPILLIFELRPGFVTTFQGKKSLSRLDLFYSSYRADRQTDRRTDRRTFFFR